MSLWKLRVGAEAYYLSQVASGLDDYYSGQGESVGRWVGHASAGLGLSGEVAGEDLRAVLAGLAPGTGLTPNGEQLRAHPRRVPGFDLTFSVPKSVSVAYALGDALVQGAVVEAGEAAVGEALAWLEREACHVRRGTNRRDAKVDGVEMWGTRRLPGAGFVGAQFRHRTSRAGDPQLHWHVLVANITRGPDGRWSALDGTGLYRSQRVAGVAFQAALRRELTARLGVEWAPAVNDAREIAGIPGRILRLFSKRRDEIETELERLGVSGAKAAEQATLATRKAKAPVDPEGLVPRWQAEAAEAGWGPPELDHLLAHRIDTAEVADTDELVALIGDRLIGSDSTFTRFEVAQAVAAQLPAGADTRDLDRLTANVLAHSGIVAVRSAAAPVRPAGWEERYTTRRLLALEQSLADAIASGVASGTGALASETPAGACALAALGPDQIDAVTRLCTQGNQVEVLVGRAGTGKTYTLATVASAYRTAGWHVIGVAPSARAARELETGAAIKSFTIPRFDHHLADQPLTSNTVVVVDEAGMCGTVDLHHVVTTVRTAGAKVVLVGDHHQLPEVQAGGGLAAAISILGAQVTELTVNRRQREQWEIDALDHLRHGDVAAAWDAYRTHDRVRILDDPDEMHRRAVEDWWAAHTNGHDALLLAGTRSEAAVLNRLARERANGQHLLRGPALTAAGRTFQAGDRVLICRNDTTQTTPDGRETRIDNGTLGVVAAVDVFERAVDITLRTGVTVRLAAGYLAAGHLDHGYAMTIHKSQGATCDQVFVVGPAGLYREAGYVALSRARHGATLYATTRQAADVTECDHATGLPLHQADLDAARDLVTTLTRRHAKTFATTIDPAAGTVADLAELPLAALEHARANAASAEARARARGFTDPADELTALARARHARGHLVPGRRARALDRDNVGTVLELHDHLGTATVLFVARDGTTASRQLPWSGLKPIDHPHPVTISDQAEAWLTARADALASDTLRWDDALRSFGVGPGDASILRRAIDSRTERVARQLHADQPDWLTWWIGVRPADPTGASVWDDTVTTIATWRDRHHVNQADPGLGPAPADTAAHRAWFDTMTGILDRRAWLTGRPTAVEPVALPALTAAKVQDRIGELERHFANAPSDQSRILDDLIAGHVVASDLHAALALARQTQSERDRWILANWPYIVEHHELQRLAERHDPLAHWPAPVRPAVAAVLDRLASALDHGVPTESRTIGELRAALAVLDPGKRLRELTAELVALNDRISNLQTERASETGPERHALLTAEHTTLRAAQTALRTRIGNERDTLRNPSDAMTASKVTAAIATRFSTVYNDAIQTRPDWLIQMLTDLDDHAPLDQCRPSQLAALIQTEAARRDSQEHGILPIRSPAVPIR